MTEKKENDPYLLNFYAKCSICGVPIDSGEQTLYYQQQMTYLAEIHFETQHPNQMVELDIEVDTPSAA